MSERTGTFSELPPDQQAIRGRCFHPSGSFIAFKKEEIEQSIPARFEKIVRMYPDRLAVKDKHQFLTYDELNKAANRVARTVLYKYGTKSEPVVLLSDHGAGGIISCLGILKAGKILVAVDPSFPRERMAYVAEDSKASGILTGANKLAIARALAKSEWQVINTDAIDPDLSVENIGLRCSPDDPAVIRYTSGSSGKPKGVLRSHRRNLYSHLLTINAGRICPDDRLLVLRNLGFGIKDTFNGLLTGAAVFPFDIRERGLATLAKFLQEERITYYISTPSIFRYFVSELSDSERFPSVRMIQLGGEPLFKREVESYKKCFPSDCTLMNQLSANEMGTLCQYVITKETEIHTPIVPVGYPVDGKQIFLLGEDGEEVGSGLVGEIAVRSRYLSSGYWNAPELNDSKFLPDPTGGDQRIYLTGDLARKLPDGCFVYVGRKDDQIKIRGSKAEISEVQALLLEHSRIKHAAVVAWDREDGEKTLAAYVVSRESQAVTVTELHEFLSERLPNHMIPSSFAFLDSIPLTNGKLDRGALPKWDHKRPVLRRPYVQPRSEVERNLAQVWAEVLSLDRVGIHDGFFELGGHSLAATRVVSRIINTFQVEVPLRALFAAPTVAEMAAVITEQQGRKLDEKELNRMLAELESLSDEEAKAQLASESTLDRTGDGDE